MTDMCITKLSVAEAMSHEYGTVSEDIPIHIAIDLMLQNHWGEVLVLNESNRLIGLVTKERLVRIITDGTSDNLSIKSVCCNEVITTDKNEDLVEARDVMRRYRIGRLPVLNHTGEVIGILTARDVCNGFSGKLEMLGEHMYSVMENIAEAIQVINCDGIVTFWNYQAEKLFGVKASEITGRKLADFFSEDLLLKVISTLDSYHNVLCDLNGIYVVRNALPVIALNGEIIGAVCTSLNVNCYKNLLEQLDRANAKVRNLERFVKDENQDESFYTINFNTRQILAQAQKVGRTDATVLIQGESGTGKELMAHVLYESSKRIKKPFIAINCSAIPETLFESEMFGYEPGTFTGAQQSGKKGKFEIANGGTIFLDEIGELPLEMQAKLLRVLQQRRFYRVGGTTPITSDVRVVAATNQNLCKLAEEGKFRRDLYYRLSVVVLEIPPLRERKDDIPGLIKTFLKQLALEYKRSFYGIDPKVIGIFSEYSWPGNVRQLHNMLESVAILAEDNYISIRSLEEAGVLEVLMQEKSPDLLTNHQNNLVMEKPQENLDDIVIQHEKEVISKALAKCHNNKAKTARMLGIPRSTLYYKLKSLGIMPAKRYLGN